LLSLNTFLADLKTEAGNGEFQIQNGFSITEAMERIARKTGREPYFPHNCAVVIGRAAAEQGIGGILRFFTEFSGCRGGVPLFMADNTAAEVLQYVSESTLLDARALNELTDDGR
jgi:hypothetical protein